jgi:hypothetical protein
MATGPRSKFTHDLFLRKAAAGDEANWVGNITANE